MQLPSFDRNQNVRPAGADLASAGANKVIPVAPVNPSVQASPQLSAKPSVINMVNPALQTNPNEPVYARASDPAASQPTEDVTAPKDWTIHRPVPEKVENPPPKPMSQVLMEHIRSMWNASASAVQIEQVSNQLTPPSPLSFSATEGGLAKEMLVYTPSKVKKNEGI
jgi:hypothetical protein